VICGSSSTTRMRFFSAILIYWLAFLDARAKRQPALLTKIV